MLASEPWLHEASLIEIPWKASKKVSKPLRIGVIFNDGIVRPHPPITRCLKQTVKALEAAGHTVVPWNTDLHRPLIECIHKLVRRILAPNMAWVNRRLDSIYNVSLRVRH